MKCHVRWSPEIDAWAISCPPCAYWNCTDSEADALMHAAIHEKHHRKWKPLRRAA